MNQTTRRRFFIDLAFAGGALALIAGVAYSVKAKPSQGSSPTDTQTVMPGSPPPLPGKVAQPRPLPSSTPTKPPRPQGPLDYSHGGAVCPPKNLPNNRPNPRP